MRTPTLFTYHARAMSGGGETPLAENATLFWQVGEESGKNHGRGTTDLAININVSSSSLFQIGSISKTVTAIAVMRMVEAGTLGLDDDASDWLPFSLRNPRFPDTPITIRMLLYHGSSLIRDSNELFELYRGSIGKIMPLGDLIGPYFDPTQNPAQSEMYLEYAPGSDITYSNWGFAMLGLIVEQASGQKFEDYVQTAVFDPLGMGDASWFKTTANSAVCAIPYNWERQPVQVFPARDSFRFLPQLAKIA